MRHRLRVVRAHALAWIGVLRLALAIARGRVDQVWIGDSHAVFSGASAFPPLGIGSTGGGHWVWHLGPRLMFSIARDGFTPGLHRAFRLLGRIPRNRDVVWLFSFGEIDIRCHLAPRVAGGDRLDFVAAFVRRLQDVVGELGVPFVMYVVPVPPAVDAFIHESFPVIGTKEERNAAHALLRRRVLEEVASATNPRVIALDCSDDLRGDDGWFSTELQTDGVHLSDAGREVTQASLRRLLADVR